MSRFAKLFAANAIAAAGLGAAIAFSPAAAAEPVLPPIIPDVPALGMIQQLAANPAGIGAVLQTAATALSGASSIVGAPAPSTLPVSPIAVPGAAPVASAAAPTDAIGAYLPLLNQLGIPANLANLGPAQMPFPVQIGQTPGFAPAASAAPVTIPPATTAQPAPVPPTAPGIGEMPVLSALP
jgi:hypothetical protein